MRTAGDAPSFNCLRLLRSAPVATGGSGSRGGSSGGSRGSAKDGGDSD